MSDAITDSGFKLSTKVGDQRRARLMIPASDVSLELKSISVSEGLSIPYQCTMTAYSSDDCIDMQTLLGKMLTVEHSMSGSQKRYFTGYLTQAQYLGRAAKHAEYSLCLQPFLALLGKTADCRIFQNETVPDIVKKVCQAHGFSQIEMRLSGQYASWDYCVQYRETTLNFIDRLLEQEGITYFFEHERNKHTLVLADHRGAHPDIAGNSSIPYKIPGRDLPDEDRYFESWRSGQTLQTGQYTLRDYNLLTPRVGLTVRSELLNKHDHASFEYYDYPGEYADNAAGETLVKKRLQALQATHVRVSAGGNVGQLLPGHICTLTGHPRTQENREYLVLSVEHNLNLDGYSAGSQDSFHYSNAAQLMPADVPYCPALNTPKPRVEGVQTAIVTGPEGEEIWTDQYGRVIVQFHWDRLGEKNENSSCWVPVSQNWAGKQWGVQFLPRIGDEVIVSFLEGDPDRPVITGRLYNGQNKPMYALPDNQTQSGVKTHSTKDGSLENYNEVRFEDKKGEELITIHAEKDQTIEVENNENHWVGNDRSKTVDNNETVTIGVDRTESVGKNETISIGENRTESVSGNESITISKNRTEEVSKNETVNIGENKSITIGKNLEEEVGENRNTDIGKEDIVQIGKKLMINVGDEILIKTGKASISMQKDGTIVLQGKDITLKGSGKITVKASKDLVLKGSKIAEN